MHLNPERHFGQIIVVDRPRVLNTWSVIEAGVSNPGNKMYPFSGLHLSSWSKLTPTACSNTVLSFEFNMSSAALNEKIVHSHVCTVLMKELVNL